MDIQVGDRVTYRYINDSDKKELVSIITDDEEIKHYIIRARKEIINSFSIEILKIERPRYEVVEEKKELLTDEEREFLKLYIKFSNKIIDGIKKEDSVLNFMQDNDEYNFIELVDDFKNLRDGKLYTLSELGLES